MMECVKKWRWLIITVVACCALVATGFSSQRTPARPLSKLLKAYPAKSFSISEGISGRPGGGWNKQRVQTYAIDTPLPELQSRLDGDMLRLGLFRSTLKEPIEWKNADGSLRMQIYSPAVAWRLPAHPPAKLYLQVWEPRRVPVKERLNEFWFGITRPFRPAPKIRFSPVRSGLTPATGPIYHHVP